MMGEQPKQAALREVLEEVGLHVLDPGHLKELASRKDRHVETWYYRLHISSDSCVDPNSIEGLEYYNARLSELKNANAARARGALVDDKSRRVCVILTFNPDEPTLALIARRKRIPTEVTKDIAGEVVVGMRVEDLMIAGLPVFEEAEAQAKR